MLQLMDLYCAVLDICDRAAIGLLCCVAWQRFSVGGDLPTSSRFVLQLDLSAGRRAGRRRGQARPGRR